MEGVICPQLAAEFRTHVPVAVAETKRFPDGRVQWIEEDTRLLRCRGDFVLRCGVREHWSASGREAKHRNEKERAESPDSADEKEWVHIGIR